MNKTRLLVLIIVITVSLILSSCGVDGQVKGEIVGIYGKYSLSNPSILKYEGKLGVLLPNGENVVAECDTVHLSDLKGCPKFDDEELSGGFILTGMIILEENQKVLLIQNENGTWEVVGILK
jgi:hypothetical protein